MSVRTTADEKLDNAKKELCNAIDNLSMIIIKKVWGSDEFSREYYDKVYNALFKLVEIRDDLA